MRAGKLIKTASRPWVCGMKHCLCIDGSVLALWEPCSRFLNPFSYEPLLLRHPAQLLCHNSLFFSCKSVLIYYYFFLNICLSASNLQSSVQCTWLYVAILWDQYNICWSIDTRAQMANHQSSVSLSITLSLLLNRGLQRVNSTNRMNSSASLSLSQRKLEREGEMDGWCCALTVETKKVERGRMSRLLWCENGWTQLHLILLKGL